VCSGREEVNELNEKRNIQEMCVFLPPKETPFSNHCTGLRSGLRQLPTIRDSHLLRSLATLGPIPLDLLDVLHAINDASKDDVLPIQPRRLCSRDEKLRPVRVLPGVRHGHDARSGMNQLEVLIRKLFSVNGLASGAIAVGEVTPLTHKVGNNAME